MALFLVPLMDDESLTSFCSRLAHANARTAMEFCQDFGFSFSAIIAGNDTAIALLSEVSGIEHQKLDAAAVKRCGENTVWVAGEQTPFMFQMRGMMKFCPGCFNDDEKRRDLRPNTRRYIRKLWYTRSIRTCPIHSQSLVSAGTHGQPTLMHDLCWSLDYLRREIALASRETVPQTFSPFESYIRTRLTGSKPGNTFLDSLPLYVAADVCDLIGLVDIHGKDVMIADMSERERWQAEARGYQLLEPGLEGLHRFLEALYRQCDLTRAYFGGNELFGKFHSILTNNKKDIAYEPVREAARSFAFANLPLTQGTLLFGKIGDARFFSYYGLASKHGISERLLKKYLQITGEFSTLPGTDIPVIPAAEADRLVVMLNDLVRATAGAKILGVTVTAFNLMVAGGLVTPVVPTDEDAQLSARFSVTALIGFRDSLLALANTSETAGLMPIKKVSRSLLTTVVSILSSLLRGELATVAVDDTGSGIMSLMLARDEVESVIRSTSLGYPEEVLLTIDDLCIRLWADAKSISRFIKMNLIEVRIVRHPITGYPQQFATTDAAQGFADRYVSLAECCQRFGLVQAAMRPSFEAAGVQRVFPREEVREVFYSRPQAEAAMASMPRSV